MGLFHRAEITIYRNHANLPASVLVAHGVSSGQSGKLFFSIVWIVHLSSNYFYKTTLTYDQYTCHRQVMHPLRWPCHCAWRSRKPGCPGLDVPYWLSLPFRVLPAGHDTCGGINLGQADPASLTSRLDGRAPGSAVLCSFTREFHPPSVWVTKDRGARSDIVSSFVRVTFISSNGPLK